jgi:hypothetical protein
MKWRLKSNIVNETKSWFFEKINKIDKPLAEPNERAKTQMDKSRDKKGVITTEKTETQRIF